MRGPARLSLTMNIGLERMPSGSPAWAASDKNRNMLPSAGKALAVVLASDCESFKTLTTKLLQTYEAGVRKVPAMDCRYLTAQNGRTTWHD
jgi:hypothetical protein